MYYRYRESDFKYIGAIKTDTQFQALTAIFGKLNTALRQHLGDPATPPCIDMIRMSYCNTAYSNTFSNYIDVLKTSVIVTPK